MVLLFQLVELVMSSDIAPQEAKDRVSILIHNTEVLRDTAQTIAVKEMDSEMTHLSGQFQNLLYDLRRMEKTTGPEDMSAVFDDGLKRLQYIRKEEASEGAISKVDEEVGDKLKSWD